MARSVFTLNIFSLTWLDQCLLKDGLQKALMCICMVQERLWSYNFFPFPLRTFAEKEIFYLCFLWTFSFIYKCLGFLIGIPLRGISRSCSLITRNYKGLCVFLLILNGSFSSVRFVKERSFPQERRRPVLITVAQLGAQVKSACVGNPTYSSILALDW